MWDEAPRKVKVRKQFETVGECPGCGVLSRQREERVGTVVMLAKVTPGPTARSTANPS